jgi:hypothetical protein
MVSALNRRSALTTYVIPLHIIYKLFKYNNNNNIGRYTKVFYDVYNIILQRSPAT